MSTPKSVLELAKKSGAKMADIKFVDTFGTWQHFSIPIGELNEDSFSEGLGFDGSSIRGWKSIEASDMLALPDPDAAFIDPYCAVPTLSLTCTIAETGTREAYTRDTDFTRALVGARGDVGGGWDYEVAASLSRDSGDRTLANNTVDATARTAAWVRSETPSLAMICSTWILTVPTLSDRCVAISRLVCPSARSCSTSRSRTVRRSSGGAA